MIPNLQPEPKFTGSWWSTTRCAVEHCDAKPATVDLWNGKRCAEHPPEFSLAVAALIAKTFPGTALAYVRWYAETEEAA